MKYLFVLLMAYSCPVNGQSVSHTFKFNYAAIIAEQTPQESEVNKLFMIDHKLLDSLIKTPNKPFKICIFFEYGCWACKEKLLYVIDYLQANQKMFDVHLISFSPYEKEQTVLAFVNQVLHFKDKVFVLDEKQYRTQKWSNYKLNRLLKELLPKDLCPQCNRKKIGYSDFILFDQQGKPIYNSTYDTDGVQRVQDLKAIVASAGL